MPEMGDMSDRSAFEMPDEEPVDGSNSAAEMIDADDQLPEAYAVGDAAEVEDAYMVPDDAEYGRLRTIEDGVYDTDALLNTALQCAQDIADQACVAKELPVDHPLAVQVFREAITMPPDDQERYDALKELAQHPDQREAWMGLVDSALAQGGTTILGESGHPLEKIIAGETDHARLKWAAILSGAEITDERLLTRVMRATTVQFANNGQAGSAGEAMDKIPLEDMPAEKAIQVEECFIALARLAAKEAQAHPENPEFAEYVDIYLGSLKHPHMYIWGCTKTLPYAGPSETTSWAHMRDGLLGVLDDFSPRQRLEIVDDLTAADELDVAAEVAIEMIVPAITNTDIIDAQAARIVTIARRQAETDLATGIATLGEYEAVINESLSLDAASEPNGIASGGRRTMLLELNNRIVAERIALFVAERPDNALAQLDTLAQAHPDTYPRFYLDQVRSAVATAFANTGNIEQAVEIARQIEGDEGEYSRSWRNKQLKCHTFVAIAQASKRLDTPPQT